MHKTLISLISLLLASSISLADSPLTSIEFYKGYTEVQQVNQALTNQGKLNPSLCKYLISDVDISFKLSVINALGWDSENKNNAFIFLKNSTFSSEKTLLEKGTVHTIICYAYLMAMDNYFDVTRALEIANTALQKKPENQSIHLIHGLIKAQLYMNSSFCEVFKSIEAVKTNPNLKVDFNATALKEIYDYTDLYKNDCP